MLFLLASAVSARAACNTQSINSGDATGIVNIAFTYTITVTGNAQSYSATGLPPGLSIPNASQPTISGTPTTAGVYPVTLTVNFTGNCTLNKAVTFTISNPSFVGFRLPDFLMSAGTTNNPRLMLQVGANGTGTTANRFNATLEVDATGTGTWVPYNRFVGVNDSASWITDAPLPVRNSGALSGAPQAFGTAQLTQSPPAVYMKADPRATRFGIFQMDTNLTATSRILLSLWPNADGTVPNGFGGTVGTDVEHVPNRFSTAAYYPATFAINGAADARDNATTTYVDNDNVSRPADAIYPDPTANLRGTGSWTPYYMTSTSYHPIMLNRPFRNVAELGYAFRDLPWKTLDFFSDKSADAGLLDIFTINDGPALFDANGNFTDMGALPTMTAGSVNLNTTQGADLQAVLAGSIVSEIGSTTVSPTDVPVLAANVVNATSATPMQNKSELITRTNLPTTILPTPTPTTIEQPDRVVKTRREVVARTLSSVGQTRVWNLVIDVVAQSGRFKPNATSLQNDFIVEGEQHYWVHVAIDRFTGRVIDKQIEVVNE
ncbi:MAG TPA: Ig domain-containing protein [Pyrinomonadaceae bacterium]|nr:Ig domain-containing protein [Pyrinomonadaceae bacterium]